MAIFRVFRNSALELKNIRCITVTAMLIALDIALKSVTIPLGDSLKISFAFLALATIGMLFGPTVSLIAGAVTDILGFMIFPSGGGGFNPLFTVVEATGALIYGLFLYNLTFTKVNFKKLSNNSRQTIINIVRIVLSKVTVVIICNLIMTPMANILSGYWTIETAIARFPDRFIKNCIQCPVDCALLIIILFPVLFAYKSIFRDKIKNRSEEAALDEAQTEKPSADKTAKI